MFVFGFLVDDVFFVFGWCYCVLVDVFFFGELVFLFGVDFCVFWCFEFGSF